MDASWIELDIAGVSLHAHTQQPQVILRELRSGALIPYTVGPYEAEAILAELESESAPEPFAYDSIIELFRMQELFGLCVELEIDNHGRCHFWYIDASERRALEMRASDGIAIATRLALPIYARDPRAPTRSFAGVGGAAESPQAPQRARGDWQ